MRVMLLISLLLFVIGRAMANDTTDDLLAQADALRTSNVAEFAQLMGELAADVDTFNDYQRDYYRYLQIYLASLQGQFKQGISDYQTLIDSTAFADIRFRALYSVVNNYAVDRDFYNASIYLAHVFALRPEIEDENLLDQADLVAGLTYNESGQHALGLEQATLMLARELAPRTECLARHMQVEASIHVNNVASDESMINQAIEFCAQHGEALFAAFITTNKVRFLLDRQRVVDAKSTLEEIKSIAVASNYSRLLAQVYSLEAEIEWALGNADAAHQAAQEAISFSAAAKFNQPAINAYRILYEVEDKRGNLAKALDYYIEYAKTDKAYLDEIKLQNIAIEQAKHEYVVQQQQLALANNRNELLQAEAKASRAAAQNQLTILLFLAALLVVGLIWMIKSHRTQKQLKILAETDGLTELKNRRQFYLEADAYIQRNRRKAAPASFVIFDLDHFKLINDKYGHAIGDWALVAVSKAIRAECRRNDILGRLGGEEFGLFLPNCDQDSARAIAEHLREVIARIDTSPSGEVFSITASFGVAELTTNSAAVFDDLFTQSDTALYQSKSQGRNRVYCYTDIAAADGISI